MWMLNTAYVLFGTMAAACGILGGWAFVDSSPPGGLLGAPVMRDTRATLQAVHEDMTDALGITVARTSRKRVRGALKAVSGYVGRHRVDIAIVKVIRKHSKRGGIHPMTSQGYDHIEWLNDITTESERVSA